MYIYYNMSKKMQLTVTDAITVVGNAENRQKILSTLKGHSLYNEYDNLDNNEVLNTLDNQIYISKRLLEKGKLEEGNAQSGGSKGLGNLMKSISDNFDGNYYSVGNSNYILNSMNTEEINSDNEGFEGRLEENLTACSNVEKNYIRKHIELYLLSQAGLKTYQTIIQYKKLYIKLRKMKLSKCPEKLKFRKPKSLEGLDELLKEQQNHLDYIHEQLKTINSPDNVIAGETIQIPADISQQGGATDSYSINNQISETFSGIDKLMGLITLKQNNKTGNGKLVRLEVMDSRVKLDEEYLELWKDTNDKYLRIFDNTNNSFTSINTENIRKLIEDKDLTKTPNLSFDELFNQSTISSTEIAFNGETDEEITEKYEQYFIRCHLYEYLYVKKHIEFLTIVKFLNVLYKYLVVLHRVLTVYIEQLELVKCDNTESKYAKEYIKNIRKFLKDQNGLINLIDLNPVTKNVQSGGAAPVESESSKLKSNALFAILKHVTSRYIEKISQEESEKIAMLRNNLDRNNNNRTIKNIINEPNSVSIFDSIIKKIKNIIGLNIPQNLN
jgi:hypothetical protein